MFMVIYLAPGDYHRYHSPAVFTANYRRHIAGYLEPVRPSYLEKHKDVLKDNERVSVLGEWKHGMFAMSFIGALNVGSIRLLFDDELRTNKKKPQMPYITDRSYTTLSLAQSMLEFPVRNRLDSESTNSIVTDTDEKFSITKYLNEFDIKDIVDVKNKQTEFNYSTDIENKVAYNLLNGFRRSLGTEDEKEYKELLSKFEGGDDELSSIKRYTVTPQGVLLRKGEEIGMFEMGSTIAMIFECPQDY
jgi:phosphatidylserine decarboxylase